MVDEVDRAQRNIDALISSGIRAAQKQHNAPYPQPDNCLNCYAPLEKRYLCFIPRRWCDADCREDWEKRRR